VALLVVLKAALAALAVSLPPGPAAALCGAHLHRGPAAGAAAALGAALADFLYGLLAAKGFALSVIEPRLRCGLALVLPSPAPSAWPFAQGFLLAGGLGILGSALR
jgi:threonine/homoserine/homoserine lactone efflux protein